MQGCKDTDKELTNTQKHTWVSGAINSIAKGIGIGIEVASRDLFVNNSNYHFDSVLMRFVADSSPLPSHLPNEGDERSVPEVLALGSGFGVRGPHFWATSYGLVISCFPLVSPAPFSAFYRS